MAPGWSGAQLVRTARPDADEFSLWPLASLKGTGPKSCKAKNGRKQDGGSLLSPGEHY